jgi:NADPH2:quinone reductase
MRAVVVREYGGPDAAQVVEVATPEPAAGQVRVKVSAAGVNPIDLVIRNGTIAKLGHVPAGLTQIGLGWDLSGSVDALGTDVTGFAIGEKVIGLHDVMIDDLGGYAEYIVLPQTAVAAAPKRLDPVAAATLPLNAVTAWQALDLIDLRPGRTLLITGAAGAVGGFLVELGAARGLHVVAAAASNDEDLVRGFGAKSFIARTDQLADAVLAEFPDGVDGAIDPAVLGEPVIPAVADGGKYVSLMGMAAPVVGDRVTLLIQAVTADPVALRTVADLADRGELTTRVAATFSLTEVAEAHRLLEAGGLRGRVLLVA